MALNYSAPDGGKGGTPLLLVDLPVQPSSGGDPNQRLKASHRHLATVF